MCDSCIDWMRQRSRPDWPIRLRRVLGNRVRVGLPAATRVRDERGRFVSAA